MATGQGGEAEPVSALKSMAVAGPPSVLNQGGQIDSREYRPTAPGHLPSERGVGEMGQG